jgi:hypothetical protein
VAAKPLTRSRLGRRALGALNQIRASSDSAERAHQRRDGIMSATRQAGTRDTRLNAGDVRELTTDELDAVSGGINRSMPNGRTDVIKAMGNAKW